MKHVAQLGNAMTNQKITLTETEILYRHYKNFRKQDETYPVAGARATAEESTSGFRGQHHQVIVTVDFPNGEQIVYLEQLKGAVGRMAFANAKRFAAEVNRVGVRAAQAMS